MDFEPERARRFLHLLDHEFGTWIGWIYEKADHARSGEEFAQELKPLRRESDRQTTNTCNIAPWPVHAGDEAVPDRVAAGLENDRYRGGCRLCCEPGCGRGASRNDTDLIANELSSHRRQPVVLTIRPPIFDQHVAALYVANFTQTPSQRNNPFDSRTSVEIPNHRRRRLLRARRERPGSRAA